MLNFAIIGFGGLGKVHFRNLKEVMKVEQDINLVAICDVEESAFTSQVQMNISTENAHLDVSKYKFYKDAEEMFDKEQLDFVITALPTYLHAPIAIKAMERGIHVFSEKPMAVNVEQAQAMLDAAKKNNVKLLIGQCIRYFPSYNAVKKLVDTEEYGKVRFANFVRWSMLPRWSWQNWFVDEKKSGGVVLDLHVHDLDYISYVFGKPKSVYTKSSHNSVDHDTVVTLFNYDGMVVTASSTWGMQLKYPFTAEFTVAFERATVELKRDKLMIYTETEAKELEAPHEEFGLPTDDGYVNEMIDFIECIKNDTESKINPPEASKLTVDIAYAEKQSAIEGREIEIL